MSITSTCGSPSYAAKRSKQLMVVDNPIRFYAFSSVSVALPPAKMVHCEWFSVLYPCMIEMRIKLYAHIHRID